MQIRLSFSNENIRRAGLWLALGVLALGGFWLWLGRPGLPRYRAEDVVQERPLRAAHALPSGPHSLVEWNDESDSPRLELSVAFHDFGTIDSGKKAEWVFPIYNRGSTPLVIQRAYTTCECTDAAFSASVIPPGKVSLVKVTFDPSVHGTPGSTARRGVIFETNDPTHPQSELWVQAKLR